MRCGEGRTCGRYTCSGIVSSAQLTGSADLGLHKVEPSGNKRKSRSPLS